MKTMIAATAALIGLALGLWGGASIEQGHPQQTKQVAQVTTVDRDVLVKRCLWNVLDAYPTHPASAYLPTVVDGTDGCVQLSPTERHQVLTLVQNYLVAVVSNGIQETQTS